MKAPLLLLLTLFFSISLTAQHLDVGISLGNANYIGDILTPKNGSAFKQYNPSFGVFARWNTNKLNVKAGILMTEVEGDDSDGVYPERQLHFRTPILESSLTLEFNIVDIKYNYGNSYCTPYIFAGIAMYRFNPQTLHNNRWVDLQPLGTEGQGLKGYAAPYNLTQIAIPLGAGLNVKIDKKIGIRFELGFRKLFTDYLDDISGTEVNYLDLVENSGPVAASLSAPTKSISYDSANNTYRRGLEGLDMYFIYDISFTYTLGQDAKLKYPFRYR